MKIPNWVKGLIVLTFILSMVSIGQAITNIDNNNFIQPEDYTQTISTEESWNNEDLLISGSVLIDEEGSLTVDNSVLTFQVNDTGDENVEPLLYVMGSLFIYNSIIQVVNTSHPLTIEKHSNAKNMIFENVTIEHTMFDFDRGDVEITDCLIESSFLFSEGSSLNIDGTIFIQTEAEVTTGQLYVTNSIVENNSSFYLNRVGTGEIKNNVFRTGQLPLSYFRGSVGLENNEFVNLTMGFYGESLARVRILNNTFDQISDAAVTINRGQSLVIENNVINSSTMGMVLERIFLSEINKNNFYNLEEPMIVKYSRLLQIRGNRVYDSNMGYYFEKLDSSAVTANSVINCVYGINVWSSEIVSFASNTVSDANIGINIVFSEGIRLYGNEIANTALGINVKNTPKVNIQGGNILNTDVAIRLRNIKSPIIALNTFDGINDIVFRFRDTENFKVYKNNFEKINTNDYLEIDDNSSGSFYVYSEDEEMFIGNYYDEDPTATTFDLGSGYTDDYPSEEKFTVPPIIEFVLRDVEEPTNFDTVKISVQAFIPAGTNVEVYLDYRLNNESTWNEIQMTNPDVEGSIYVFDETIPAQPYDTVVDYRVRIEYTGIEEDPILSANHTYTVNYVEGKTDLVFSDPVVFYKQTAQEEKLTRATDFRPNRIYVIEVNMTNITTIETLPDGKLHVNISLVIERLELNETEEFSVAMDLNLTKSLTFSTNDSLKQLCFQYELESQLAEGDTVQYRFYAENIEEYSYTTVKEYLIEIKVPEAEDTGYNAFALLFIGGSLLAVQAINVIKKRKNKV